MFLKLIVYSLFFFRALRFAVDLKEKFNDKFSLNENHFEDNIKHTNEKYNEKYKNLKKIYDDNN